MDAQGNINHYPSDEAPPDAQIPVTEEEAHALRNVPLSERHCELGLLRQLNRLEKNNVKLSPMEIARLKQWFRAGFKCAFGEGM
jgi:hypothetical protein